MVACCVIARQRDWPNRRPGPGFQAFVVRHEPGLVAAQIAAALEDAVLPFRDIG
jgi:hypothetical protein